MQVKRLFVAGSLVVPIYFPVRSSDRIQALQQVANTLSNKTISVIHGDIHTWNGKEYPVIARRCNIEWHEVVNEEDTI